MSHEENDKDIIVSYLRYRLTQREEDFWAFEQILMEARCEPNLCWGKIQGLLLATCDESELSYVAAGPLEDLFNNFPDWTIARVTEEIGINRRLAFAVTQVWLQKDNSAFAEIEKLVDQYKLRNVNPLNCENWP